MKNVAHHDKGMSTLKVEFVHSVRFGFLVNIQLCHSILKRGTILVCSAPKEKYSLTQFMCVCARVSQ